MKIAASARLRTLLCSGETGHSFQMQHKSGALEDDRENAKRKVKAEIRTAVREDNINSVVLGCAGMVHMVDDSDEIPVKLIDGIHTAVKLARMF